MFFFNNKKAVSSVAANCAFYHVPSFPFTFSIFPFLRGTSTYSLPCSFDRSVKIGSE